MATLKRVKNPTGMPWEVRWRDPRTGRQRKRRYLNRDLAERAHSEAILVERADPRQPMEREGTVRQVIAKEAKTNKKRKRRTRKTRDSYIRNHVPEWFLDRDVRHVGIEDVETVLATAGSKICETSVEKLRSILHSVFKYGVERRYAGHNPVTGARITVECVQSGRARKVHDQEVDPDEIPSPGECRQIAVAIRPLFRTLVQCLFLLGLRLGEALALDVADWNSEERRLRVWRSDVSTTETKGRAEYRHVYVTRRLAEKIDRHIAKHTNGEGPLFPGPRGGRLTQSNFRRRYFYPAVDVALGQHAKDEHERRRIRPVDLRHTAASLMITEGMPDIEIARQLGHTDTTVTRRVYAGVWRRHERQVDEKMEDAVAALI